MKKLSLSTAIFLFLIATPKTHSPVSASKLVTSSPTHQYHQDSYSPSFYAHRKIKQRNPPPPAPSLPDDFYPRFGVETRLVPGGPNPLHN
ncbi:hypothetical protein RHMOL_Rhmol12G0179700 [Rhododendron molle]|uniref:Uncharacterized protein n=1 Tax=Rhododendron molle TaxID=49168 RepID=A0ACC0LJQ8_RHOML|nr:hypothetical protein RHMOL_Rhmol12G0179700 [Rhododendron molle]